MTISSTYNYAYRVPYSCPTGKSKCEINSFYLNDYVAPGLGALYKADATATCWTDLGGFKCTGETQIGTMEDGLWYTIRLNPGDKFYGRVAKNAIVQYSEYELFLRSDLGIKVPGSTQCQYDLRDEEGITYTGELAIGECRELPIGRHVCASADEQCSTDADCKLGHTLIYNGLGAECSGTLLEWYGCRAYSTSITDIWGVESRCEVIGSKQVQCCPTTGSCGVNAVCDPQTFTCSLPNEVECTANWECGTQQICDRIDKIIEKPICVAGTCDWQTIRNVECCYDTDCPSDYYCDENNLCQESITPRTDCPDQCCVGDIAHYDKPCPDGQVCCADGTCAVTCGTNVCDNDGLCEPESGETGENCINDCSRCDPGYYWDIYSKSCVKISEPAGLSFGILLIIGLAIVAVFFLLFMYGRKK